MEKSLKSYCSLVDMIEKERNKLLVEYYSKNIFKIMFRKNYKKMIDKYDNLLIHCYTFIEQQLEDI